jgi:two-component system response regulator YesN
MLYEVFNLIIVDDEKTIRAGFKKMIANSKLPFNVLATYSNGTDAIERIKKGDVHLVITDIKMMSVTGLDLARFIYENYPHIPVIIISGYANFDYAVKAMKYNVNHYLSKPTDLQELRKILRETYRQLQAVRGNDKELKVMSQTFLLFKYCKQLLNGIIAYDYEGVEFTVNQIIYALPDEPEELLQHILDLQEMIWYGLEDMKVAIDKEFSIGEVKRRAKLLKSKEEYRKFIINSITSIMQYNEKINADLENISIYRAKKFIDKNYNKNISLEEVAAYSGLSPTYFSRLFRKVVGKNFIDYLTGVRIDEAKKLLQQKEYKVYEVSKRVGFQSSNYFNTLFKKYTGMTPLEYSEQHRGYMQ